MKFKAWEKFSLSFLGKAAKKNGHKCPVKTLHFDAIKSNVVKKRLSVFWEQKSCRDCQWGLLSYEVLCSV